MIHFNIYDQGGRYHIERDSLAGTVRSAQSTSDTPPGGSKPAISEYPREISSGHDYASWGEWDGDDNLPNRIDHKLNRVAIGRQAILKLAKLLYGNGLIYVKETDLAKTARPDRHYDPDVEEFFAESQIPTEWFFAQCVEWQTYWNTFSEAKLSRSRKFITHIYHKEAPFCRLSKQDKNGVIKFLLYDARFGWNQHRPGSPKSEEGPGGSATAIPLMPWFDKAGFMSELTGYSFAWHSRFRFGRSPYYSKPPWIGLFTHNGWVDAAADVPRIVNAMQKSQIQLKYQIIVEETYFKIEHPEWDNYTTEQRSAALDEFENSINDKFVGVDKGFSSILSVFRFDAMQGKELGKVEVKAIDDKLKQDSWIPGAERANFEIVQGLGAHPTDFGLARENGAMGSGSGSDKREVFNTAISTNTAEQECILSLLNHAFRYNGWRYRALVDHTSHTTSNLSETGLVPSKNTVQPDDQ